FFQAEDGIRDGHVTGVQTCALPICPAAQREQFVVGRPALKLSLLGTNRTAGGAASQTHQQRKRKADGASMRPVIGKARTPLLNQIGRASCRERVEVGGGWGMMR